MRADIKPVSSSDLQINMLYHRLLPDTNSVTVVTSRSPESRVDDRKVHSFSLDHDSFNNNHNERNAANYRNGKIWTYPAKSTSAFPNMSHISGNALQA